MIRQQQSPPLSLAGQCRTCPDTASTNPPATTATSASGGSYPTRICITTSPAVSHRMTTQSTTSCARTAARTEGTLAGCFWGRQAIPARAEVSGMLIAAAIAPGSASPGTYSSHSVFFTFPYHTQLLRFVVGVLFFLSFSPSHSSLSPCPSEMYALINTHRDRG